MDRAGQRAGSLCRLSAPAALNSRQREIEEARAVIIRWVEKSGLKLEAALETLNVHAGEGRLDSSLAHAYAHCHDKKRGGDKAPQRLAKKTYYNWLSKAKSGTLAPAKRSKDLSMPEWAGVLLQHYRLPQKPTLTQAMAAALPVWTGAGFAPFSYDQAYRLLKNLETYAPEILYRGRNQGAAMKAMLPFVRRDTENLWSNDVWTGDGHGMKAKVQHPDHGRPFTPEVTVIMDVASRKVLGWSVSFAENVIAVCDALRHAVTHHGIPLIYYSDNGSGQTGKVLDAPIGGMLARLGINHETGIPGNPQGRGMIERLWGTLTIPLAKQLPTYRGNGADGDFLRKTTIQIEKDIRAGRTPGGLPTLPEFVAALDAAIAWYNGEHVHSALNSTPDQAYAAKLREADLDMLDEHEKLHLFRPHVERTAARGEVSLWHNIYYSADLMAVDKQKVLVGYDLHDPAFVVVRRLDGEFICRADWNANKKAYFPESKTDNLREQRVDRRLKKLDGERELALAESIQRGRVIDVDPEAVSGELEYRGVLSGFAPIEMERTEAEPEPFGDDALLALYATPEPKPEPKPEARQMVRGEDFALYLASLGEKPHPTNETAAR